MAGLQKILLSKPYLAWYIKDPGRLTDESAFEHILNYGNWEDFLKAKKTLGIKKLKIIFENISNRPRVNLRKKTINYYKNYFQKYA